MALNYNSLIASTIKHYKKEFVDNIIGDFILLAALGSKDLAPEVFKMRKPEGKFAEGIELMSDPGEKIFFPLMYARNATVEAYSGYDILDITPADPFTAAEYEWRSIAGSVNMDNERLDKNSGSATKLFGLMKGMMDNLKISMQEKVNDYLLAPKAAGSKRPLGLMDLVQDNPAVNPDSGALGGIDAVSNAWWRNQVVDQANAAFGTDQTGLGFRNLRKLLRQTQFGNVKANLLLAGESAFESVELSLLNQVRLADAKTQKLIDAGFETIMIKGVPLVMEKRITAIRGESGLAQDAIYALNTQFLKVYGMKRRWFEPSNPKEPVNQDSTVQHIITRMQFATNNRRALGVLKGIPLL